MPPFIRKSSLLLYICLPLLFVSCEDASGLWGYEEKELRQLLHEDPEKLLSRIEFDDAALGKSERVLPGASWYIAQLLESRGFATEAEELLLYQIRSGGQLWRELSIQRLMDSFLESDRTNDLLALPPPLRELGPPDPGDYSWWHTHRYEALIQDQRPEAALAELRQLQQTYPGFFEGADPGQGLLYYRARLELLAGPASSYGAALWPYILISDARFGHRELLDMLGEVQRPSLNGQGPASLNEGADFYPWLEAKALVIDQDYEEAMDSFLHLIPRALPDGGLSGLWYLRPDEGIARDIFVSALQSRRYEQGLLLFEELGARISPSGIEASGLLLRVLEYQGMLESARGRHSRAAQLYEKAFDTARVRWEGLSAAGRSAGRDDNGRDDDGRVGSGPTADIRSESRARATAMTAGELNAASLDRERTLWRWLSALLAEGGEDSTVSLTRAFSWVRHPDYFQDIADEHINRLFRNERWDEIHSFIRSTGNSLPVGLRIQTLSLLGMLAQSGLYQGSQSQLDRELAASADADGLTFLNQMLLHRQAPVFQSLEKLRELFPMGRSIPYSISGIRESLPVDEQPEVYSQQGMLVEGYLRLGMYDRAVEALRAADPFNRIDAPLIIRGVASAYEDGDWHNGLRLLELAVYRRFLFGQGPSDLIEAAGSGEALLELLYPKAYADILGSAVDTHGGDVYLMYALLREESRFEEDAGSPVGARGLGQIMPATGSDIARRLRLQEYNLNDADDNIPMSVYYYGYLRGRFSSQWEALAAYNAGQGRMDDWNRELLALGGELPSALLLGHIPFQETRAYIRRVSESWLIYSYLYGEGDLGARYQELYRPMEPVVRN